jgi:hypothetical protein
MEKEKNEERFKVEQDKKTRENETEAGGEMKNVRKQN